MVETSVAHHLALSVAGRQADIVGFAWARHEDGVPLQEDASGGSTIDSEQPLVLA